MSLGMGDTMDPTNQSSPIGAIAEPIQKWTDPLSWVTGGKWADITSKDLPKATNQALQPIAQPINKFDKAVNPLREIPIVNNVANLAYAKPGDAIGLAIGSVFTGGALAGAAGAGEGGAAGAAGAGAVDAGAAGAVGGGGAAVGDGLAAGASLDGIGTAAAGAGGGGGATGLTGFFGGTGAVGDAGTVGTVGTGASGLGTATAGDMGGALGSAPTGLFSGLTPGGGMTGAESGALGGGISGAANGGSAIGGGSMGGFSMGSGGGLVKNLKLASTLSQMGNKQQVTPQQMQANAAIQMRGGGGSQAHIPNGTVQQAGAMYGLPNGLLAFNQGRYA